MRAVLCILLCIAPMLCSAQQGPRVVVEVEEDRTIVGQPLTARIKVLVPTFAPKPPEFPTMEVPGLLVRLPARASHPISETVNGESWAGIQRTYRLYPLQPGAFEIPAQTVRVTYAEPGGIQPIVEEIQTDAIRFTAVVPNAATSLSPLVIADSFELSQTLEVPDDPAVGDAIVRTVEARIGGTTAILIPQLIPSMDAGMLRAYPKEPVVAETEERGVLSGSKTESTTYLLAEPGDATLPGIAIDWFNLDTGQVETARVEGLTIAVSGEAASSADEPFDWRLLVRFVAVGILMLLVLQRVWPRAVEKFNQVRARWKASEAYAFRHLLKAIGKRDLNLTYAVLLQWLDHFPEASPDTLKPSLQQIGSARFSGDAPRGKGHPWNELRAAAIRLRRDCRKARRRSTKNALKPLNPVS